ncbi:hypothetical protein JX265_006969 [Neoarthrinium moseri]|uniref:FAD/NAD(P)-binding domain-containing protein n=1 Tax=Neoarthrinium moseri TaxID=1658444 RepID=A0A9Q0ANW2_9PEZI|nr:uncharacterized protein JN550_010185 [Neoarthrinium moseri]KAI1845193.1 hypothetical protein JX266_008740 [Neoarthrinium moseri]KAI1862660.1 hypothetical protein JN550_010185 [Neoarthrinium moseri]KAI1868990.1 hypothetical protein JX265_006969 [Neoarthrinium moseri]
MADTKPHEVVILGGNFGGVGAAHYLLKYTIPSLHRLDKTKGFHITLVAPNSDVYFKVASPRALIQPKLLEESKLWRPLSEAFKQYPAGQIDCVQAIATSLDAAKRSVSIKASGAHETEGERIIPYDTLIIATGTTSASPIWTLQSKQSLTSESFRSVQDVLPKAKTVIVAGGGAVGVETAGEIASAYPSAEITLFSGGKTLLQRVKPEVGARAQEYLQTKLNVKVVHGVKVLSATPSNESPGTTVSLSDGKSLTVDLYIDATGGVPNSQFLPAEWLDSTKRIITRDAYFRVKGNDAKNADGVYVLGDIVAGSNNTIFELDAMVPTVCSSVGVDIAAQLKPGESMPKPGFLRSLTGGSSSIPTQKEFKPMKDSILVPIGPGGGVGLLMGWQAPSWLVKMAKSKSFLIELFDPMISGNKWKA